MTEVAAIVLAAGSATRFGALKQFAELSPGKRLVDAAVDVAKAFASFVVVVLPAGHDWEGAPVDATAVGGATRLESVRSGLEEVPHEIPVVVIHDAAHPLAPASMFHATIDAVRSGADAAVPFLELTDVVKRIRSDGTLETVGRDGLGLAQVPMAFERSRLEAAHHEDRRISAEAWEDSMIVEELGGRVVAVPGSPVNLHVASAADLELARVVSGVGKLGRVVGTEG